MKQCGSESQLNGAVTEFVNLGDYHVIGMEPTNDGLFVATNFGETVYFIPFDTRIPQLIADELGRLECFVEF